MRIDYRIAILAVCAAGLTQAHDDLVGTRYVAPSGVDQGTCELRDAPCRTLEYAMSIASQGDAIKVGGGTYDVSGLDLESLFFGKQGLRGGYTAEDHFHVQDAKAHATIILGADEEYVQTLLAHGFTPVDENGVPMQRTQVQVQPPADCVNGMAGQFPCWNIDYLAQIPLTGFSSQPLSAANVWGFVHTCDNSSREYAVIGLNNGTAVIDVTEPASPVEVGFIQGVSSSWREVKILQVEDPTRDCDRAYAYMSTEGTNGGLQIIDLSNLPASVALANTLRDYSTSHTLYVSNIDYATNRVIAGQTPFLYVAGTNLESGRFRIYDLTNPTSPQRVAVNPGVAGLSDPRGFYMHDSTSLLLVDDPHCVAAGHNPCEVLVDFNEQSVDIWDVTNKAQPLFLSRTSFANARYIHSGWPTSDQRHVIVHDELDELQIPGLPTSIYTLDITDLRAPTIVTSYTGPGTTTDHNGYTKGDRYYVSHYKRGLVIFDLDNPLALRETGYFDTFLLPCQNTAGTEGAWGVYPFLPSGTLVVSDIDNGLFVLRRNETSATPPPPSQPSSCAPSPPQVPPPSLGGGGGGGAIGTWLLIAFTFTALLGRRVTPRVRARVH